jgi:hypothetical protein
MTKFRSLLLASLLGGLAIHGALVACSGSGLAGAQTTSCQQWAVIEVVAGGLAPGPTVTTGATGVAPTQSFIAPAGWEPFGATGSGYDFRKCMP